MDDITLLIISALMGGGLFTGIGSLVKSRREARKLDAEVRALGVTTPLEAESLSLASMQVALNSVLAANAEISTRFEQHKQETAERIQRIEQEAEGSYRSMQLELGSLRAAVSSAETYIRDLLDWISVHLPGAQVPARRQTVFSENREDL